MVDTSPPTTPGVPTVVSHTASSVVLTWAQSTDDTAVTGYNVYDGTTLITSKSGVNTWSLNNSVFPATASGMSWGGGKDRQSDIRPGPSTPQTRTTTTAWYRHPLDALLHLHCCSTMQTTDPPLRFCSIPHHPPILPPSPPASLVSL